MRDAGVLSQPQLEVLRQLFSAATAEASTAMSRWTGGLITLSLDEVEETPLSAVAEAFHFADQLANMVVLGLKGELGGTMILVFDEQNGRALANRLLGRAAPESGEWSDLEQSALCETGNILVCAYMNALTRLLKAELVPTPPLFIQDFGASVLDQALMAQAACSDEILLCRTGFHSPGGDLGWHVLFVPTPEMRQELERTLSCSD
jgi:chemotaxis protein CheC